ncbi:MAG: tetratricopeptide repeat protein [Planctomycetes bacterium]|nr:tetratricopeptide repeat protein [Planctomycetota bacterium]
MAAGPPLGAWAVLAILAALAAGVEWETTGRGLEGHHALPELKRAAAVAAARALGRVEERLGLRPGKVPVRWSLDVSLPPAPLAAPLAAPRAFEAGRTAFDGGTVTVTLPARKHLRSQRGLDAVVLHEAVHAVLASRCGSRERYEAIPGWLREGLALHAAEEGETAVLEAIAERAFAGAPADSFLAGAAPAAPATPTVRPAAEETSYGEAYLRVRWIEERIGAAGLKALCSRLAGGQGFPEACEALLGMKVEAALGAARRWARERVARLLPADRERRFRESLDASRAGRTAEAARAWGVLLEEDPGGPLGPTLRYLLAKRAIEEGGPGGLRAAREHLEAVLSSPGEAWRPEALVLHGECLRAEGRDAEARDAWQEVLEAYGEDAGPAERARKCLVIQ